jgi:ABC-2 type transport system permease protein
VPGWLKTVAYLNPLTYGVDALRLGLIGFSSIPLEVDLAVLITTSALTMVTATYSARVKLEIAGFCFSDDMLLHF